MTIWDSGIQACNDPTQFPLATISNFVASFAPDLIVHVGDFYYRQMACPAANAGSVDTKGAAGWGRKVHRSGR